MQRLWRIEGGPDLAWRRWDDEYVVHHGLSNDTHRLSELSGLVLTALSRQPDGVNADALAEACDAEPEAIDQALDQLAEVGLVRAW